jgi:hypothetical protein
MNQLKNASLLLPPQKISFFSVLLSPTEQTQQGVQNVFIFARGLALNLFFSRPLYLTFRMKPQNVRWFVFVIFEVQIIIVT